MGQSMPPYPQPVNDRRWPTTSWHSPNMYLLGSWMSGMIASFHLGVRIAFYDLPRCGQCHIYRRHECLSHGTWTNSDPPRCIVKWRCDSLKSYLLKPLSVPVNPPSSLMSPCKSTKSVMRLDDNADQSINRKPYALKLLGARHVFPSRIPAPEGCDPSYSTKVNYKVTEGLMNYIILYVRLWST